MAVYFRSVVLNQGQLGAVPQWLETFGGCSRWGVKHRGWGKGVSSASNRWTPAMLTISQRTGQRPPQPGSTANSVEVEKACVRCRTQCQRGPSGLVELTGQKVMPFSEN